MEVPDPGGQVDKRGIMHCAPTALEPSRGRTLCTADERFDDVPALIVTYVNYKQPVAKLNKDKLLVEIELEHWLDWHNKKRSDIMSLTFSAYMPLSCWCETVLVLWCLIIRINIYFNEWSFT